MESIHSIHTDNFHQVSEQIFETRFPRPVNYSWSDSVKVIDLNVSSDFTEEIQNIQFPRMLIRGTKQIQDYFAHSLGIQVHPVMEGYWCFETLSYRCQVHMVCENQADQAMLKLHVTPDTLINSVIYHNVNDALPETYVLGHELTVIDKIYPAQSTR